jgi:hypothetical protein
MHKVRYFCYAHETSTQEPLLRKGRSNGQGEVKSYILIALSVRLSVITGRREE